MAYSNSHEDKVSVLIICINYHSEADTLRLINECLAMKASECMGFIVVDNTECDCRDQRLSQLSERDNHISVLWPGSNLGYFGGAKWALVKYLATHGMPDWILVTNPDISFPNDDFFLMLQKYYSNLPPAILAPSIISSLSGNDQNPHMCTRPSRLLMKFYSICFSNYFSYVGYDFLSKTKQVVLSFVSSKMRFACELRKPLYAAVPIYAAHGSLFVFHRSYFDMGGDLSHGTFLFGEEIFVAETILRLGLTILYDPRFCVVHKEHLTTGQLPSRKVASFARDSSKFCSSSFFR